MLKEKLSESKLDKMKRKAKETWRESVNKSNGLTLIVVGYMTIIIVFLFDYADDNSKELINKLFSYLGTLNKWLVFLFLLSIISISMGKYVIRKNGEQLFLGKFLKQHAIKVDLFIVISTVLIIVIFTIIKLSIHYEWILLLKPILWLINKQFTLSVVSLILSFYIVFAVIEFYETITIIVLGIVNKFYEEIKLPLDRYTLLIGFIGIIISLITR